MESTPKPNCTLVEAAPRSTGQGVPESVWAGPRVGFSFSLGPSTFVFALALLFAVGIRSIAGQVTTDTWTVQTTTGLVGTLVSGSFLYLIGIINLVILMGIVRVFRRMRQGEFSEEELEEQLNSRGVMNRFYGRLTRSIRHPWQMYPLGILFGLGFDTAT